jgi:triosephosphate isomerase (TIM)
MTKLLIANWKANPKTLTDAVKLAKGIDHARVVIAPPFPFLRGVSKTVHKAKLGAQDAFWSDGPYTGEVSVNQLKKLGVKYVILGHSERRRDLNETDAIINRKLRSVLDQDLVPILCVGEGPEFRRNPEGAVKFISTQLKLDLFGVRNLKKLIIAYEPIWAIGTGLSDSPEHTSRVAKTIKKWLGRVPVIYGGSINGENAHRFMSLPDISGALVGGASLKPIEFKKIIKSSQ